MTNEEKKIIMDFMLKNITKEDFLKLYPIDIKNNNTYILEALEDAYQKKNAEDVEYALLLGFSFGLSKNHVPILIKLLSVDWHYKHEDIAQLLQNFKDPRSIECLYKAALARYSYLDYDDSYALAVKCIWALGDINTEQSKAKLKLLSQSTISTVKKAAKQQLERIII